MKHIRIFLLKSFAYSITIFCFTDKYTCFQGFVKLRGIGKLMTMLCIFEEQSFYKKSGEKEQYVFSRRLSG